jgi:DNA-binding NarL/FixJ family response regulator
MEPIFSRWPGQKIPLDGDNVAAPPATPHLGVERRPLRMLLLEDDPLLKWAITETLKIGGHVTLEACDVAAAERAVQSAPGVIDVVLFDDHIPNGTSLDAIASFRRLAPGSALVMMTDHAAREAIREALALGVNGVILKPFEMGSLEGILLEACGPPAP